MGFSQFFFGKLKRKKMLNRGLDKLELLRIVDAVANEKSIDKELVIESMESAIQKAALTKFGNDNTIEVLIDRESGEIKIQKVLEIVENLEDNSKQITLADAKKVDKKNKDLKVGDKIFEELPQIDFGRIAAQSAKQVITLRVKEAEKNRQYEDFIDKQGQILSGIIKRLEYGNVIIDLGRAEGVIKKDELIPREILKNGDRIKAYCYEVKKELKGHQIFLSRAHPQFLSKLFFQEVPEIYEGIIEIKSVARDPGSRAKICVSSTDSSIDPVGACVGMRGSRVQTIVNELHGEKIDIIKWTEDLPTLISESLSPAEILKVLIDQENKRIDVILTEENLSKAIGRRGQNVRLASKLTNFEIDILTEKEDSERRQAEFKDKTETLIKNLEVDETLGQLLVSEGFLGIEEISQSKVEDITKIEGIDDSTAEELINRSKENLKKEKEEVGKKLKELGVEETLINLPGMTQGMLVLLGQRSIKKLSDFAYLSSDELIGGFDEIKGKKIRVEGYLEEFSLSRDEANELIMAAREIAFKDK
jgi:N utilization substance protein A